MWFLVWQQLLIEVLLDIVYFPLWWYTVGARHAGHWCFDLIKSGNSDLAPGLWLVNIFVPMYGQYDWRGRVISFFMRLVQIIARSFALVVWTIFCLALFAAWLILPVAVVWGFLSSFTVKG